MWRDLISRRALLQALAVSGALAAVLVLRLPHMELAVRLWLVSLGAIGIAYLAERAFAGWTVRDAGGVRLRWGWWRRPRQERVRALEELEHAVDFSLGTAFDVHYRLRPHAVRIATHRLAARGISLETRPDVAGRLMGPDAWALVRPDRPEPEDRNAAGLELAALRRVVEQLGDI